MLSALPNSSALSSILCGRGFQLSDDQPSRRKFQRPITGNRTLDKLFATLGLQNDEPPEYIPPASVVPSTFVERELLQLYDDARLSQSERVLQYLARAESGEYDPWAKDDIRVAWCTFLYAARGYETPWEFAFWSYYGKHPSKAIPIWLARDAERDRMLGPGLDDDSLIYPPKKPVQSVRSILSKKKEQM